MITLSDADRKEYTKLKIITLAMLIVAPLIYLVMAWKLIEVPPMESGAEDLMFYILIILALAQPAVIPIIERVQMSQLKRQKSTIPPAKLFTTFFIVKGAMIEAVYIYGLVVFFMTGNFERMLYFYPIGIIWSFIYWPREEKFINFLEKAKTPGAGV